MFCSIRSNIRTHYGSFKDWDDILVRLWRILPMKSKLGQVRRQAFYVGNLSVEIRLVVKRQGFTVVDARYPAPKWNIHIIYIHVLKALWRPEWSTYQLVSWIYSTYSIKCIKWKSLFGGGFPALPWRLRFLFMSPGRKVAKIRWHV